jgi:SHS2 domain-containing protein
MTHKKDFVFLEHTADIRFEAYGKTLDECFMNAAKALTYSITDPRTIKEETKEEINLEADDLERLLHDFLSEMLFRFDTEAMLTNAAKVEIKENRGYSLKAELSGEVYDPDVHHLKAEVKAVTYHNLKVKKEEGLWTAEVLCDV